MIFAKSRLRKKDEDEQPLYPRIVSNGTIDFQQIVKEIAQASSFTPADMKEFNWLLKIKYPIFSQRTSRSVGEPWIFFSQVKSTSGDGCQRDTCTVHLFR